MKTNSTLQRRSSRRIVLATLLVLSGVGGAASAATTSLPTDSIFAPTCFWYTPIPANAPLHSNSANYVIEFQRQIKAYYGDVTINTTSYASPVYTPPAGTPTVKVQVWDGQNKGYLDPNLQLQWNAVPIPSYAAQSDGTDAEMTIYQPSSDTIWEFWKTRVVSGEWQATWGGRMQNASASDGIFPHPYGTTATGLPFLGGQITAEELSRGEIRHVIGISLVDAEKFSIVSWPANRSDGNNPNNAPNRIPEGSRFRLDPTVNIDALNLHPVARTIAKAAQVYGFVVWDKAGAISLRAQNPKSYTQLGKPDPYAALFNGTASYAILNRFPWDKLQFMPKDYGKPGTVAPAITSSLSASATVGKAFSYAITASGSPTSFNASGLPAGLSVNTTTGVISGTPAAAGTSSVTLSATNSSGTGTAKLTLTITAVNQPPVIQSAPWANTNPVTSPSTTIVNVAASDPDHGPNALTYTWSKVSGPANGTVTFSPNATTTSSSAATFNLAGTYVLQVSVSDGAASVTGTLSVIVNAAASAPAITKQPASQTVTAGQTATFSVTSSGTAPLSYQWRRNSVNISGATGASFTTPAASAADNGAAYSVVVSNSAGSVTSSNATLTVNSGGGTDVARVNFQPTASTVPAGYKVDDGSVYTAARGYGWSGVPVQARERNVNADERLDTLVFAYRGTTSVWTCDLANGNYVVTLACGDPSFTQPGQLISIQGAVAVNNVTTAANQFVTVSNFPASVTNGKLSISLGGPAAGSTILNYVDIKTAGASVTTLAAEMSAPGESFTIQKLASTVKFNAIGHDSATLSGTLPGLPPLAGLAGETVKVWIGGVESSFVLDGKGHGTSKAGRLTLTSKGGTGKFKLTLKGGTYAQVWVDAGIDPTATATHAKLNIDVLLSIAGTLYSTEVATIYTGKAKVGGAFHN